MSEWFSGLGQLASRVVNATVNGRRSQQATLAAGMAGTPTKPAEMYALLRSYTLNNSLYDQLAKSMYDQAIWDPAMRGLRTPAARSVGFFVNNIWPGPLPDALPIETEHEQIIEPIHQMWTWSNWGVKKQVASRWLAMYGDLFIKVASAEDRKQVYMQLIEPQYVTDLELDVRGYLRYIRLDIPQVRRDGDRLEKLAYTEVWDYASQTYRQWLHNRGDSPLEQLGPAVRLADFAEFGIDFIPIVHAKFADLGEDRGVGSFTLALDKIDEANRQATRLSQMLFRHNKPLWALGANGTDATGRPVPPPRIGTDNGTTATGDSNTIDLGDDRLMRLPGTSRLESLVPNINYEAALAVLNAMITELERDLPELAYYRLREMGDISGRAVRLLLSDAISRALEARGNAETALVRADQMALTIGQAAGIFSGLGDYGKGDFDHVFAAREIIPVSDLEQYQADTVRAQAVKLRRELGASESVGLKELGYSAEEVATMLAESAARAIETPPAALGQAAALWDQTMPDFAGLLSAKVVE